MKKYKILFFVFQKSQFIDSNCGDITFKNTGLSPIVINQGYTLMPNAVDPNNGDYLLIQANEGEFDVTRYEFKFTNLAVNCQLTVIKKVPITNSND